MTGEATGWIFDSRKSHVSVSCRFQYWIEFTFHQTFFDHLAELFHNILGEVSTEFGLLKPLIEARIRRQFGRAWLGNPSSGYHVWKSGYGNLRSR